MSHENQQLAYKCRQLKSARKIHSTWFFNNVVNIRLTEFGRIHKIFMSLALRTSGNRQFGGVHK